MYLPIITQFSYDLWESRLRDIVNRSVREESVEEPENIVDRLEQSDLVHNKIFRQEAKIILDTINPYPFSILGLNLVYLDSESKRLYREGRELVSQDEWYQERSFQYSTNLSRAMSRRMHSHCLR